MNKIAIILVLFFCGSLGAREEWISGQPFVETRVNEWVMGQPLGGTLKSQVIVITAW